MARIRTINRWLDRRAMETPSGCWQWLGAMTRNGYGQVVVDGKHWMAHRAVYTGLVADIPTGLDLDHLCRNRGCVNPFHLDPVTRSVNLRRGDTERTHNSSKTTCPSDHPYDEQNTAIRNGRRVCRACDRARAQRNREARRGSD